MSPQQVVEKLNLSKKWTISGVILILGAFFLHPDKCVSAQDLIGGIITTENAPHIAMLIGTILTILGKGLLHKE